VPRELKAGSTGTVSVAAPPTRLAITQWKSLFHLVLDVLGMAIKDFFKRKTNHPLDPILLFAGVGKEH